MAMPTTMKPKVAIAAALVALLLSPLVVADYPQQQQQQQQAPELVVGYYSQTCPAAETIVREVVTEALKGNNTAFAASLVRLHFHDCFVRGCEASLLLNSTAKNTAEKDAPVNVALRGFEVIDRVKERLEAACPQTVSCADILAFAARDSVLLSGGFSYDVPSGRRDGRTSLASEAKSNLPGPNMNLTALTQNFATKNLTQEDMVTLSGAHSIGRAHCATIDRRLYNFSGTGMPDPALDAGYLKRLRKECPAATIGTDFDLVVPMDPDTPDALDSDYYRGVLHGRGLFTSDQTLMSDAATAAQVHLNAMFQGLWEIKFAAAMVKMGSTGVLLGAGAGGDSSTGEIRINCAVVNSD